MFKIGHSKDVHKLVEKRKLILGGLEIKHNKGALGHSDADVLLHVIIESIIGAMGLGDIGTLFPDTADEYKDISSVLLLKRTIDEMNNLNYKINNLDATIFLETPKINSYMKEIRLNISKILDIEYNCVNVKATRGEGMGYIGRCEGIGAECVILLEKS